MRRPQTAAPGEINWQLVDRFTVVHLSLGVLYAFMNFSFFVSFILAMFWEALENPLKSYVPKLFPHATADSRKNSIGDIVAVCLGWIIYKFLKV